MKQFDLIIVGFGKGGKTLAKFASAQGRKVAVIEKSKNVWRYMYQYRLYSIQNTST